MENPKKADKFALFPVLECESIVYRMSTDCIVENFLNLMLKTLWGKLKIPWNKNIHTEMYKYTNQPEMWISGKIINLLKKNNELSYRSVSVCRSYRSRIFLMISCTVAFILGSRPQFFSTCWMA